ncbi:MAG: zinc-ribbon domain-containing protein [Thermodesulfovibrionales bacterium]|nr:zinc-ribbon domain-containing protein [Thermodesulfovibrionales bacterium]
MVVTCPQCKVKLKVDDAKIPAQGARFKCPKCSTAIFVKPPEQTKVESTPAFTGKKEDITQVSSGLDMKKVLIAHGDEQLLKEMERLVREAGYIPVVSQDGIEAIVKASKELPFVAVLDVALPKEYGFDVCRKLKEIEYTKDIKVILITSVYDKTRYKRPPVSLYGADDYIEEHEVKEALIKKIKAIKSSPADERASPDTQKDITPPEKKERLLPKGLDSFIPPGETEKVKSEPSKVQPREVISEKAIEPEARVSIGAEATDEMAEKARRLARTIISDIYFYNPQKFEDAVKKGTFYETFQEELKEGLKLYESRIPYEVRKRADYFKEQIEAFIESKKK